MFMWYKTSFTYTNNKILREFIVINATRGEPLNYTDLPESYVPITLESILYV
jgi:hypothetical protein